MSPIRLINVSYCSIFAYPNGESYLPGLLLPDHDVQHPVAERQLPPLGVPDLGLRVLLPLLQVLDDVAQRHQAGLEQLRLGVLALDALLQGLEAH